VTQPLNLALTLSLNDRLVAPLQRALGEATKQLTAVSRELGEIGKTGASAAAGLGQVAKQSEGLKQTTAEIRKLGQETRDAERSASRLASVWGQLRNVTRGIGGVTAGAAAFSAVVAAPVRRAADYDTQLRGLANTAYAGQSLAARRAALGGLDASITGAVRFGGGTREGAMEALNELVASGAFSDPAVAAKLLPLLQRGATASGASPTDLARIAIRGQQTFGIPAAQMGNVLDQAMAAGQAGGFELKDMAKWLPQQMAAARQLGLSGPEGLVKLLAANQASVITAGTKDEAGNNLVNLLAKVNSQDTGKDFQKLGIDLPGSLSAARGKGVDGLTAFVNMVDQIVAKDARFQAARQGVNANGSPFKDQAERRAAYESQGDILQGSAIGKVIQDRQALMALVALMNNRGYMADVEKKIRGGAGSTDDAFALFAEGSGFKFDQRNFEMQKAQTDVLMTANGALGQLAEHTTELYRQFPGLAQAVEGSKLALLGFTAALTASGLVSLLTRGAPAAAAAAGAAGAGAGAGTTAAAAAGGLSLASLFGGIATIGAGLSLGANRVVSNNLDMAQYFADDTGLAAAILGAGGGDDSAAQAAAAQKQLEAAATMNRAADKLSELKIGITSDSTMFTGEIIENVARQASRQ